MEDIIKIDVIFRKFNDGSIIGLFPHNIEFDGCVLSYMHIGQHSSANYQHCIKISKLATKEEYRNLSIELIEIGYDLNIIKKQNYSKYLKSYHDNHLSI